MQSDGRVSILRRRSLDKRNSRVARDVKFQRLRFISDFFFFFYYFTCSTVYLLFSYNKKIYSVKSIIEKCDWFFSRLPTKIHKVLYFLLSEFFMSRKSVHKKDGIKVSNWNFASIRIFIFHQLIVKYSPVSLNLLFLKPPWLNVQTLSSANNISKNTKISRQPHHAEALTFISPLRRIRQPSSRVRATVKPGR